ncbi:MAG: adenylosuccinate lyase [Patescibacteria group bacterium]|nr:adenylosuccinate lyase [Patescibacteria group bacterium]
MIARYNPKKIHQIWQLNSKFAKWLLVELAMIKAREDLGVYPKGTYTKIKQRAQFSVKRILELEVSLDHDLLAFVETVRQSLPKSLRKYIHDGMTSYDTEEPALSLQLLRAARIILEDMNLLVTTLRMLASDHAWTYCMAFTHIQYAKVTTLGWRFVGYLEFMERSQTNLLFITDQLKLTKCSGAVGNYATIDPELEARVCDILGLGVRPAATQIVHRDVIARFMGELAIISANLEKIATDIRLMSHSAVAEVMEPFKKTQKGSSAMPHKKNPITSERVCGQARLTRAYAHASVENIATWFERDISQSSVERVILPDATAIVDYQLQKMNGLLSRMTIRRERMAENINSALGLYASEEVKLMLCGQGFDPEEVYALIQRCAFTALKERRHFKAVLLGAKLPRRRKTIGKLIDRRMLNACFDFKKPLRKNLPRAYRRMSIDTSLALTPNC